jgi:ribosome maturation factor RimP
MSPFLLTMIDKTEIIKLIDSQLNGTDIFLVEAKISPGKISISIDKPAGITINECIALNRYLTAQLEATGILETHELEVSSPGMDQPLKVLQQYQRRLGKQVRIITTGGIQHEGKLLDAKPEGIEIVKTHTNKVNRKKETTEEHLSIPFETIKETKLIINI